MPLDGGVHVDIFPVSPVAGQGTSATYRVVVTNTTNDVATFGLCAASSPPTNPPCSGALPAGLAATFQDPTLTVDPGTTAARETILTIAAAPGTPAGIVPFNVTVTSTTDPQVTNTAQTTLTISDLGLSIALAPRSAMIAPGTSPPPFTGTITNTGSQTDTYSLDVAGLLGPFASLSASQVTLDPGQSQQVTITLSGMDPLLQQRSFVLLEGVSETLASITANDFAVVDLGAFRNVTAAFDPTSISLGNPGTTQLALAITNAGNACDERYTMVFSSNSSGNTLTAQTTDFLVPPQKTASIPVTLMAAQPGIFTLQAQVRTDTSNPLCPQLVASQSSAQASLTVLMTCTPLDQCHVAGVFDPNTLMCSNPTKPDGAACDDNQVCTTSDMCEGGVCKGTPVADGTPCDDGRACTQNDHCQGGICLGMPVSASCVDNVLCYQIKLGAPFSPIGNVTIGDALASTTVNLLKIRSLCTPADVGTGIIDSVTDLQSYQAKVAAGAPKPPHRSALHVSNAVGDLTVDTVKLDTSFVPTAKALGSPPPPPNPMNENVDHYDCYKVKVTAGTPKFPKGVLISVADEFTSSGKAFELKKPTHLCEPTDMNKSGIKNPTGSLFCYQVKPAPKQPKLVRKAGLNTSNEFGTAILSTVKEKELCIGSTVMP